MKLPSQPFLKRAVALGFAVVFPSSFTTAFPPAPHHTLYGLVRDQWGAPLSSSASSSEVILQTPTGTELHTRIVTGLEPGVNYRLEVPMDSGTAADLYQPTALRPFFQYRLKVVIGQTTYLPIQMAGGFAQIGQPGQATRVDLTLGVDSDGDGLPDAWEQQLIAIYGGDLSTIRPNDDSDGDGISNLDEYLAGTYAFDPSDGFVLTVVGFNADSAVLEFLTLRGRNYSVQTSPDLSRWSSVSFRLSSEGSQGALRDSYQANDVRTLRVEVPPEPGVTNRFFRALVQ